MTEGTSLPPGPPQPPPAPRSPGSASGPQPAGVVIRPVPSSPTGADDGAQQWWKRRGAVVSMVAGVVVVVAAIVLAVVLGSGSADDATDEAAQDRPAATSGGSGGALLDMDTSVSTTAAGGDSTGAGDAPAAGAGATEAPGGSGASATGGAGGGAAVLVPRFGAYTFTGSGSEKTMPFLPNPVAQGPTKPATVTDAGGGCWRLSIRQNANHGDEATFCAGADASLTLDSLVTHQTNNLGAFGQIDSTLTTTCRPRVAVVEPAMAPGARFPLNCTNHTEVTNVAAPADMNATGSVTFVGIETVAVGGVPVAAYHLRQDVDLVPTDGTQPGSRVSDVWIATDNGMVLRERRSMTASAKLLGQVSTYIETSEHVLDAR